MPRLDKNENLVNVQLKIHGNNDECEQGDVDCHEGDALRGPGGQRHQA